MARRQERHGKSTRSIGGAIFATTQVLPPSRWFAARLHSRLQWSTSIGTSVPGTSGHRVRKKSAPYSTSHKIDTNLTRSLNAYVRCRIQRNRVSLSRPSVSGTQVWSVLGQ
ncbi:hypothetical protein CONLIGDRAFT_638323 [Coniochaeta ligniaria NRRL 30616]|uniref:Uncharacterized protein n=1 Tax=Coniochaeta ligniaria NRRL 30616 TaxID=1408157 RepID=A0A1J7I493_9PEZI|nr:hypothetical protein CONLIGDRAFT_638323 [Coniochaeta ligniaria NRRL 30616]